MKVRAVMQVIFAGSGSGEICGFEGNQLFRQRTKLERM
jgi:hypothetical protein